MKNKILIILFFLPFILSLLCAEIFTFLNKNNYRHIIDYKTNKIILKNLNKKIDHVLLGDSLLDNAIGNIKIKENILDLSTSAYLTLPGNYLLLRRFLNNTKHNPKNIYLFFSSSILNKISNGTKELYYKTVFNKKDELSIMQKIEKNKTTNEIFLSYFLSRKRAFTKEYYTPKERIDFTQVSDINTNFIIPKNYDDQKIIDTINQSKQTMNEITDENIYAIQMISKLALEKKINIYFILEPVPFETNMIFKKSNLRKLLVENNYKVLNINNFYTFDNYFFKDDGIHIKGNMNKYYSHLIDKYIIDIF